ncbi:hypothetical protein [Myxococcus stipitatus]|uniref:hypothetical protein n=1 Tax=Myxococcus stipitatus TaxID=83455 RepID=UPI001E345B03|nr:hypothetical protein [Myxococcus stipitatus]
MDNTGGTLLGASTSAESSASSLKNCPGANPPNMPSDPGCARTGAGGGAISGNGTTPPRTGTAVAGFAVRRAAAMCMDLAGRRMP